MNENMANDDFNASEVITLVRNLNDTNQGIIAMALSDYALLKELSSRLSERNSALKQISEAIEEANI
ncbi:MAG: hypothetical protein IIY21_20480 [Clostridiales bacterium]|nr:hypothetical protein [Clostridiales bacterium]MBQ1572347.1 hypothetical protein [Clostridiales bacterium]